MSEPNIAEYVAVLLVMTAQKFDGGISSPIERFYTLPSQQFNLEVDNSVMDAAIKLLAECDIASVAKDQFAGRFVAIKKNSFDVFMTRVAKDLEEYDSVLRSSLDENEGVNRAESRHYPYLDLLNKHKALRSYSRFGKPWIDEVLKNLRAKDPVDALSTGLPVNSAAWTGLAERITPSKLSLVREKLSALRVSVEQAELDPRQRKNAFQNIAAINSLLDAPDPPWKVIVELLNSPVLTAFLNTTAILALLFG